MIESTWIVVAHEAGARFFENQGRGTGLELVEEIEHADGRARDRDMASDRPGRSFRKNSGDPSRASMGQSEGPHDRAVSDFARALAHKLEGARVQNRYKRLVLVAPPRFLGLLRSSLDGPTAQLVMVSLDKDFAATKKSDLVERLSEVITL
ncbi:MAG: host attachment protein [Myxococcales bacterium]|jgi:protein required for attachment to host cells|nr:MAG: host attachment protein [Myxococcales bacterium]